MIEFEYDNSFSEEVRKLLSEELSKSDFLSKEILNPLKVLINNYLLEIKSVNTMATKQIEAVSSQLPEVSTRYAQYIAGKQLMMIAPQINQLLKDGYYLIDRIGQLYAQGELKYQIDVDYGKAFYEGQLDLRQILEIAHLEVKWDNIEEKTSQLRVSGMDKTELMKIMGNVTLGSHSTLFSSIREYASASKIHNINSVYEAYNALYYKNNRKNRIPPASFTTEEFDEIFSAIRKKFRSSAQSGDIFQDQNKFFGTSVPSLTAINTIRNVLTSFLQAINVSKERVMKKKLNQLFYDATPVKNASRAADEVIAELIEYCLEDLKKFE